MGSKSSNPTEKLKDMDRHGESASQYLQSGNLEKACEEYQKAVDLGRSLMRPFNLSVYLLYLAVTKVELKQLEEAEALLIESIETAALHNADNVMGQAKLVLGELLREMGKIDQAMKQLHDACDLATIVKDPAISEFAYRDLGRLYLSRGWAELACACFTDALHQREETLDKAALNGSLGLCMAELGKFDLAIVYYRTAYLEAEFDGDVQTMSVCKGSEGNALFEIGSFSDALARYEQALALSEKAEDTRHQGIWLGNMGTTWLKLGDADKAAEFCLRAAEIAKANEDAQSQASHLDSVGDCYFEKGDLTKAREYYSTALELSDQVEDRLGKRIYLANLGKLSERTGQLQPAFEYLARAADLFDEQRATIKTDDLKTSFANRGEDLYKNVVRVSLALGKRIEALEYVGRAKSRALVDLLSNSPIDISHLSGSDDEALMRLIVKERELRGQIDRLERIWQGPSFGDSGHRGGAMTAEDAHRVYSEWREVVSQLRRRHPNYAELVSSSTLGFNEIKSLWTQHGTMLREDTVIIEYFWTDEFLVAASVASSQKEPVVHMLSNREQRDSLAIDLETFLEMSSTEGWEVPISLCRRLYDALLKPVIEGVNQAIGRLVIIPHGSLFHLPFAALHDGESYLCEKFSFSYLPSISLIPVLSKDAGSQEESMSRYLISAISDYSATRLDGVVFSSSLRSAAGLDDLSYTMEEARNILEVGNKAAHDSRLITNEEVKENFSTLFGQYPVVHFAGHAVFSAEEPMSSGLVLADGTVLTAASILERSSLRTECGRLLVLSACQTGVNLVTPGGEILGLARALMYAGMPNLVLSLWEVADRSTSDLMQDFHNAWQAGKVSIADALRTAQRRALANGQPIHAWAPFIHFGID